MRKKQIYPKTKRVKVEVEDSFEITEKIDGSNLVIFKMAGEIYVAPRNTIYEFSELEELYKTNKNILPRGLYEWLKENIEVLQAEIYEGSAVCGEWIGEKKNLKYTEEEGFSKKYYMFAKGRVTADFELENIVYNHAELHYMFISKEIPECIGVVPIVCKTWAVPSKEVLDEMYEEYGKRVGRKVEGFIVNYRNSIRKYVRMKNGKLQEHFNREG